MSYLLPHLHSGWEVDQAILSEEDRVVIMRFGHDWDDVCMQMDEVLNGVADKVKNFAVIYLVDITQVPDFNSMYELYDPCTVMFFYRNKVSLGVNKIPRTHSCLLLNFGAALPDSTPLDDLSFCRTSLSLSLKLD